MKRLFRVVTLLTCLLLLMPTLAVASNESSKPKLDKDFTQEELEARFQQIHSVMRKVHEKEITHVDALNKLAKIGVFPAKGYIRNNNGDEITIQSNPDYAIWLPTAFALKDTETGYWYAGVHFFWKDPAYWQSDFPNPWPAQPGVGVNIGGYDGFGIAFSRGINRVTQTFDVYDTHANRTSYSTPSKSSSYGVGYTKQDYGYKMSDGTYDYNWDSGYLGIYFTPQEPGQEMSVWQEMAHTWETTSVSITGISYIGISWQFNKLENRWNAVAPYAYVFTPY
ncbi:Uncharacterized [Moorella glycerini]|uniref:Uncharacterized protein n=1 Tax=Neomoorella stamsii TaxID=1266720 RepID=A0A9X7IZY2_9FIRM|nr:MULTISPECIES: hypothetical protein [Moorella]PRR68839.1 hypothetical protein MOST_31210 [Moorella stamsii]CEP67460.1 Uncharacterized [Moorella glycerini]